MKNNPLESQTSYQKYVDEKTPNSPIFKNCFNAFWVGGLLCAIGQIIFEFSKSKGIDATTCSPDNSTLPVFVMIIVASFETLSTV